jgi:L-amino acid N-acyltransferase YncA
MGFFAISAGDSTTLNVRGSAAGGACYDSGTAMRARMASVSDAPAIARIYNEGIEDRIATFETRLRSPQDVESWFDGKHPVVVVEDAGEVIAFAATSGYRPRACYAGIAELSVYVARIRRRQGAGRLALEEILRAAERAGFWKLLSRVFPENAGSRALVRSLGFREVGTYEKHGRMDGMWRDVIIVERLIPTNL